MFHYVCVCVFHILFIHSCISGHLACFCFWATVNNTYEHGYKNIFLRSFHQFSWIWTQMCNFIFNLLRNDHTLFPSGYTILPLFQLCTSLPIFVIFAFLIKVKLMSVKWYFTVVLNLFPYSWILLNLGPTLVNEILAQQLDNRLTKCLFLALHQEHEKNTFRLACWEEGTWWTKLRCCSHPRQGHPRLDYKQLVPEHVSEPCPDEQSSLANLLRIQRCSEPSWDQSSRDKSAQPSSN